MFSYVFWHTRSDTASQEIYELNLLAFYDALKRVECPGVQHTATFRISSLPWSKQQSGYEDWAVIEGTGVLEDLNQKAIQGSMERPHTQIARLMDGGNGGVYYHLWGELEPYRANRAQWLTRQRGIQFRQPLKKITDSARVPVSVWRRFMVLGPGPEFIIFGSAPLILRLQDGWQAHGVDRVILPTHPAADLG